MKGNLEVVVYDYFTHIHRDNKRGKIVRDDYISFNEKQLNYFFNQSVVTNNNSSVKELMKCYGRFDKEQIGIILIYIRAVLLNDSFYNGDINRYDYRNIKTIQLIDCELWKRFYIFSV